MICSALACHDSAMANNLDSPGARLRWARERTGIDAATMARIEGLNDKTYRAYENDQNGFARRAADFAARLNVPTDWLLKGGPIPDGTPPTILGAVMESNARLAPPMEGASSQRMRRDVPIYGTALGAEVIVDGEAIEQTELNRGEVVGYRRRPVLLDGRADVYALYVQGSSMHPRHRDGAILYVESRKRPAVGDDAVIYLRAPDGLDGERTSSVLVKTLVRKSASFVELEQYSPATTFKIPMERVERMDRVLTLDEMTD
jgi:phage repressor protein C with HTH and peptisase S24 domain